MRTTEGDLTPGQWKARLVPADPETRRTSLKALAILVAGGGLMMGVLVAVFLIRMPWPAAG